MKINTWDYPYSLWSFFCMHFFSCSNKVFYLVCVKKPNLVLIFLSIFHFLVTIGLVVIYSFQGDWVFFLQQLFLYAYFFVRHWTWLELLQFLWVWICSKSSKFLVYKASRINTILEIISILIYSLQHCIIIFVSFYFHRHCTLYLFFYCARLVETTLCHRQQGFFILLSCTIIITNSRKSGQYD